MTALAAGGLVCPERRTSGAKAGPISISFGTVKTVPFPVVLIVGTGENRLTRSH
jgi:hypothetical protein